MWTDRGQGTIAVLSAALGVSFGFGLGLALLSETYVEWGLYMSFFAAFHFWEYLYNALFHPNKANAHCK
jgi:hypothetical protein